MKIAVLALGTRGDVEPLAILAKALRERGHDVTLCTAKNFDSIANQYGVKFLPVDFDYEKLLNTEEGKEMMKGNVATMIKNLKSVIYPLVFGTLSEFYKLANSSDKIIYHSLSMADSFAELFPPNKMVCVAFIPEFEPTTEFANVRASGFRIPTFLNKFSYKLTGISMQMMKRPIVKFRKSLGLGSKYKVINTPIIYGISQSFLPKPQDFREDSVFAGFLFGDCTGELLEDMLSFLKAGSAPLLITFGSMPFECKFDFQSGILRLVRELNIRVIVVKSWGIKQTEQLENNPSVKIVDTVPYQKLFPHIKAVIHHGGLGTTAECLRAGKPFFVCPVLYPFGDQNFWGMVAYKKGLAVKPVALKKMTEKIFVDRAKELLTNNLLYTNAIEFSNLLVPENGVKRAVEEIEKYN